MHLDRLTNGERLACISAIGLFVSLFLDWFIVSIPESLGVEFFIDGTRQSAWDALDYIPIILTIAVTVVVVGAVLRLNGVGGQLRMPANSVVAILGTISVLFILFRIIDPPKFGSFQGFFGKTASAERSVEFGIFVGLLGAAGIAYGGVRAIKEEGSSSARSARG